MLFSVEQAFVGREEIRAPRKTPAWEATSLSEIGRKFYVFVGILEKGDSDAL